MRFNYTMKSLSKNKILPILIVSFISAPISIASAQRKQHYPERDIRIAEKNRSKFSTETYFNDEKLVNFNKGVISENLKKDKITKIEPSNWWIGMNDKVLQICVYGDKISQYTPEIDYYGVEIANIERTDNPNYIFIYLNIADDTNPGFMNIDFKKEGKSKIKYGYPLLSRESAPEQKKGFTSADAVYLLMPDRFANGDPSNDSNAKMLEKVNRDDMNGRHGGDIKGISDNLDYIADLGFTAIWSTPMMVDNLPTYSYHTYAISDYYNIDPRYGSNNDYRNLSKTAKEKGVKLIMDVVTNHCSTEHYMVKDLPSSDWIHENERCNFRVWTVQDPYASESDRNLNSCGWFDTTMADLNQRNSLLMDYLIQNAIWWIEFADLSGLRIDTYPYNYKDAMTRFNNRVMGEYPNLNIVGEVWMHEPVEIAYWQKGAVNHDGFNSCLPTVMDFPLSDALNVFSKEEQGWESGIMHIYKNFTRDYMYPNPDNLLIFADNHDTERLWKQIDNDIDAYKMIFGVLSTVRGIPQVYYGTEIMMSGIKELGDGDIRKDFPGGWHNDERSCFNESGRTESENEVFNYTRKLLNWRKNKEVIHTGNTKHFLPENNLYVYFRYNDEEKVMVIINNNKNEITVNPKRFSEILDNGAKGINIIDDQKIDLTKLFNVKARSCMIVELQ